MPEPSARRGIRPIGLVVVTGLFLSSCGWADRGALAPEGPAAQRIATLFYVTLAIAGVVIVAVLGLWAYALFHRRSGEPDDDGGLDGTRFVVVGGVIVPTVILMGLMGATFVVLAQQPTSGDVEVTVTGHQYWWEVSYASHPDAVTANEIHIPAGRDVELTLRSDDVLHSFWVPQLAGKVDMVPGRTNTQVIRADQPGTYRGHCAEYCGLQHGQMNFRVVAQPPAEFERWLEDQAAPAVVDNERAFQVFRDNACAACHTIRGTPADGERGPDLTHVADRDQLAAGAIDNTRANLTSWVVDAQSIKAGAEMPPIPTLSSEELEILVDYLENLQ